MRKIIFLWFLFFGIFSCVQKPSGTAYNDAIINPQKEIAQALSEIFTKEADFASIEKSRNAMVESAKKGLNRVDSMQDFEGNTAFKDAAKEYYQYVNQYFSTTPNIDSILYNLNSPERMKEADSKIYDLVQSDLKYYLNLETNLLNKQQEFLKEFQIQQAQPGTP